ncbi:potassium channel family protein [Halocatena salina]|uniref:Potassium channel protein n=1 Tax=Halocatena salina TaxID=2934340 RepID=A0A8T9ZYW9_9EURY|nr:potassium channel family protein [Halocatena salina]UPM41942.1 potassium channel protein [Halocatena salina]
MEDDRDENGDRTGVEPGAVEYEPVGVKHLLSEMKDTAELLIDLSYSSVLFGSQSVAQEVLTLEQRMDVLQLKARMSLLMAARNPSDAEALAPVLGVVAATEKISDAAGDIAKIVTEEIGLPDAVRGALPEALETLVSIELAENSDLVGRTLGDRNLETETGVRVIALRRQGEWLLNPDRQTEPKAGDVLLLRGPEEGIDTVYTEVTGREYPTPDPPKMEIEDVGRAVDSIVLMKNMSELAVDLAYGAVLFDNRAVAREVRELEIEVDALQSRFEAWTLRAASRVDDTVSLRGLVHLAQSSEVISDAALEISDGVLRGLDTHPVVTAAVEESVEIITRLEIDPDSTLDDETLGDQLVSTKTGMRVIAVRRGTGENAEWIVSPGPDTRLKAGDVIIAKGTRAGSDRLEAMTSE